MQSFRFFREPPAWLVRKGGEMETDMNLNDLGSLDRHELRKYIATFPDDHPYAKLLLELL